MCECVCEHTRAPRSRDMTSTRPHAATRCATWHGVRAHDANTHTITHAHTHTPTRTHTHCHTCSTNVSGTPAASVPPGCLAAHFLALCARCAFRMRPLRTQYIDAVWSPGDARACGTGGRVSRTPARVHARTHTHTRTRATPRTTHETHAPACTRPQSTRSYSPQCR